MRVAICDDERRCLELTHALIFRYLNSRNIEACIDTFTNASEILKTKSDFDFVFMDIEMEAVNGLTAAKKLRERNPRIMIFFITHYDFYLDDAMNIAPFRYLPKPIDSFRLYKGLDIAVKKWYQSQRYIKVTESATKTKLTINMYDILFIENSKRKTKITTKNGEFCTDESYRNVKSELLSNEDFSETHQSFVVNFNYVKFHSREKIILEYAGKIHTAYVSRRKFSDFSKKFLKFAEDIAT